jgi:hypothetical protein
MPVSADTKAELSIRAGGERLPDRERMKIVIQNRRSAPGMI